MKTTKEKIAIMRAYMDGAENDREIYGLVGELAKEVTKLGTILDERTTKRTK